MRSQVQAVASARPRPEIDPDGDLVALHVGGGFGLVVGRVARAFVRHPDIAEPDRELVAIGRLAGLADRHHDAAPIGVLAGHRGLHQGRVGDRHAMRLAELGPAAPVTFTVTNFRAPSPSRATCWARSRAGRRARCRNGARRRSLGNAIAGAPRLAAAPVANRSSVSDVEVSPSTVTQLKLRPRPCEAAPAAPGQRWAHR